MLFFRTIFNFKVATIYIDNAGIYHVYFNNDIQLITSNKSEAIKRVKSHGYLFMK